MKINKTLKIKNNLNFTNLTAIELTLWGQLGIKTKGLTGFSWNPSCPDLEKL